MRPTARWGQAASPKCFSILRTCFVAAFLAVLLTAATPAMAKYASIVVDADTGEVLHAVNADTRNYPASLTKMMTLYLLFERLKSKRWTMDTRLQVSARAAGQPPSKLGLKVGSTISVKDAIQALVIKSANDVASVVADNISGDEVNFALKMTDKARSLGMKDTIFRNASGLPHRAQMSTAKDMYILARSLLRDFPEYYHFFSQERFEFRGEMVTTHNNLLNFYPGADGFKTGYIRASGFNLVASATHGGRRLIGVVFGGRSSKQRDQHMASLLDEGFAELRHKFAGGGKNTIALPRQVAVAPAVAPASSSEVWAVQVGAFSRPDQARAAAAAALAQAQRYLTGGEIKIVALQQRSGAVLHRARIVGISKRDAFQVCKIIKDCMELKDSFEAEMASTAN